MVLTPASIRAAVLEQTERTRQCSKVDIQRFIEESESNIISLDSQINALIQLRDSQCACILALRYIISPIRTLPVELLAEIFDLAIDDVKHVHDAHRLSQVCSHWRQVAHNTPRLWARPLFVNLYHKMDDAGSFKMWLACSVPMPLSVIFWSRLRSIDPGILKEVLRVAPRLGLLEMSTTPSSLARQLVKCRLDSLEELNLGTIKDDENNSTPLSFTAVPRLRKLSIRLESTISQPIMPWAQLTNLTVSSPSPAVTFGILSQCASLLEASLSIPGWPLMVPEIKHPTLVFTQLQTLFLEFLEFIETSEDIASFFDCLSAPQLQDLELIFTPVRWPQAHFTAFQLRAPDITHLKFAYSKSLTSDDVVAAIRNAPSLTHLKINRCDDCFDDAFIRTLHYGRP